MELYIPGKGYWNPDAAKVDAELNLYDERLSFRCNPDNGDWCVYYKTGHDIGVPVLGFGREIPSPDYVIHRIIETDTRRHGDEILKRVEAQNDEVRKVREEKSSEAAGVMAEGLEWAHRKMGTHPQSRVFVPRGIS